jgi:hypothetical protein
MAMLVIGVGCCCAWWYQQPQAIAKREFRAFAYAHSESNGIGSSQHLEAFLKQGAAAVDILLDEIEESGGKDWGVRYHPNAVELLSEFPDHMVRPEIEQRLAQPSDRIDRFLTVEESRAALLRAKAWFTESRQDIDAARKAIDALPDSFAAQQMQMEARFSAERSAEK